MDSNLVKVNGTWISHPRAHWLLETGKAGKISTSILRPCPFTTLGTWAGVHQKLLHILRDGTNTFYELRHGEKFVWALYFTAVVIREVGGWKFTQMIFSFPTIYFPDVRLME